MQNLPVKSAPFFMKTWAIAPIIGLKISIFFSQAALAESFCSRSLEAHAIGPKISKILDQPHLRRTRWGIDIRQVSNAGDALPLYARNAEQLFLPASTAKLFTSAALVETFRADYRIETPYFAVDKPPTLKQLRIRGSGDPSILDPQLRKIGRELRSQGVKKIGTLIGESRAFDAPAIVPSWEWEDLLTSDGVPMTSLSFSQNSLPLRLSPTQIGQPLKYEWLDGEPLPRLEINNRSRTVSIDDSEYIVLERSLAGNQLTIRGQLQAGASPDVSYVAIASPEMYFLHRLKAALKAEGIRVKRLKVELAEAQRESIPDPEAQEHQLGAIVSPPLTEMLREINQSSNNFYSESLLRHLAWVNQSKSTTVDAVTPQDALSRLESTLQSLGVDPSGYQLKDASGLSRQNLVSPESLTSILATVLNWRGSSLSQKKFRTFQESLAVAGQSGTLKLRFQGTPVAGKLFAKTGTLSGTVTLAGFLQESDHPTMVLSIMANQSDQSISALREIIDQIVLTLHQAQTCQSQGL